MIFVYKLKSVLWSRRHFSKKETTTDKNMTTFYQTELTGSLLVRSETRPPSSACLRTEMKSLLETDERILDFFLSEPPASFSLSLVVFWCFRTELKSWTTPLRKEHQELQSQTPARFRWRWEDAHLVAILCRALSVSRSFTMSGFSRNIISLICFLSTCLTKTHLQL